MLLGGGPLLLRVAKWAKKNNYSVYVITSPRHANEEIQINGDSLSGKLKENKIPFAITSSIEEQRNIIKQGIAVNMQHVNNLFSRIEKYWVLFVI